VLPGNKSTESDRDPQGHFLTARELAIFEELSVDEVLFTLSKGGYTLSDFENAWFSGIDREPLLFCYFTSHGQ
jgi:hypothetical protein